MDAVSAPDGTRSARRTRISAPSGSPEPPRIQGKMAKHKAATEITIVQEERSSFAEFVDRYKWWGAGILMVVAGVILWRTQTNQEEVSGARDEWNKLFQAQMDEESVPNALAAAVASIEDPTVRAWAGVLQSITEANDRNYGDAETALSQVAEDAGPILKDLQFPIGKDGASATLVRHLSEAYDAEAEFFDEHLIYENPDPAPEAPKVAIETSEGRILIQLYIDKAPQHAKNFLKLAESGYYNDTKFHRLRKGEFIQGGDPNTIEGDPATWGIGGPEYTIPPDNSGLKHVKGAVAAAKKGGATESSGSQFYITAQPMHRQFDGNYEVFGIVVEGIEIVEKLADAETEEENQERPKDPAKIVSTEVIE